ncbi:MAG: PKD domain-containing protein, partial [Bacteroidota bacterium]
MIKKLLFIFSLLLSVHAIVLSQDCTIDITKPTSDTTICLGDSIYLESEGSCDVFMNNGFEGGIGVGWSSTAANPTFPDKGCDEGCWWGPPPPGGNECREYKNGAGPNGPFLWVGATNSIERTIITDTFDVTIGNCYVKFWMRFGRQANNDPGHCEDPESVGSFYGAGDGEGVHLQYSIDDGVTWVDFTGINQFPVGPNVSEPPFPTWVDGTGGYWDPTPTGWGGHTSERYDTSNVYWWHEYSCPVPPPAETTNTRFRFAQLNTDQEGYDTWGIDEVKIFCSNNQNVIWNHGPTVFNPTTPVAPTDTTQYVVMVYDTVGNFATDTITIYVAATPDTDLGNDTTICWDGTNTAIFNAGAGFETYLWNTGDTVPIITPDTSGTYIVEVWNATCYDTDTVNLTVIPATVANAGSDESVCQGDGWDFHGSATTPFVISADSILWFGGAGTFVDPNDTLPIYYSDLSELGPVSLGMIAYGSGPCGNDTSYMTLTVDTVPVIDFSTTPIDSACYQETITFIGTTNCQIVNWDWNFGDGNTGTGQTTTHAYNIPGTYLVSLAAFNAYGCVDTIEYIRVITDPFINFTHTPDSSCENDTVYFNGLGDMVTYADWIWDFGDGSPQDTGRNVTYAYPDNGLYTVTLSVCSKDTSYLHTVIQPCAAIAGSDEYICEYHPFDFSSSATLPDTVSADSLRWSGGLGSFNDPTVLWPIYTPAAGELGDIALTLIAYGIGTCGDDTSTMILSVLDGPEAGFTFIPDDSICVGEDIFFTDTSTTTIVNWVWDFDDGNSGNGQNITHTYASDGTFNVQLIVTNDTACVDSVTLPVQVHPLPIAGFTIAPSDSVCLNTEMTFDDASSSSVGITSWDWDFGDGNTTSGSSVTHTYASTGTYDVYLYILNDNSCVDTLMQQVTVVALPAIDFSMSPNDTNCVNEEIFFMAIDTSGTSITSWDWDFNDGNIGSGQNVSHTYTAEGDYNIMLVATNTTGCTDTVWHSRRVEMINIDFDMTPPVSCLGDPVNFDGTGDDVTFTTWEWDFGDGNFATGRNVTHTYATYDTFNVMLVVCSDTINKQHIVQEPALADAGSDESICEYYIFDFATAGILATANAYDSLRWITSGTGTFNDPTLLHPVYTPGAGDIGTTIQCSLIALARIPCANDTSTMLLTIFDGPEASFSFTPLDSICAGEWVNLDANSSTNITSWNWDFGDGNTGTGQNTGYAWPFPGLYDVELSVINSDGCVDTINQNIDVHPLPVAGFDILPNDSICNLEQFTFLDTTNTNTGTITSWFWDFGDGNTSTLQNPTHSYSAAGNYSVSLYVYNENSCRDTITQQVTVTALPAIDFSMSPNDTNCTNELVFFDAIDTSGTTITSWDWDFDDGNTGSGQNVSHAYTLEGDYTIMLVATNITGCKDTVWHSRRVEMINIDFDMTPPVSCLGDLVNFDGTGDDVTFTTWEWDFGDGNFATGRNVTHTYATYDTFNVMLVVCSDTINKQHIVQEPAFADAGSDESICEYFIFDFSTAVTLATANAYDSLRWITNGTGTFNDNTLLHPVYTPGAGDIGTTIQCSLIALARIPCANDTSTMLLTIFDSPEASFSITPPDSICVGEWISLDANSSTTITNWNWDFGDGNTGTGQNTGYAWSADGTYDITLVVINSDACSDTVTHTIEVFELPVADFIVSPGNSICTNEELTFNASSTTPILDWYWDFGDGTTATGQNVTHTYTTFGSYNVSLYVYNENSCRDTMTQVVNIFELPSCDFTMSPNDSSCVNELITFNGTGTADIVSWDWDFDDGNTAIGQVVTHTYVNPGIYNISLIVTNPNGCLDTMIHQRVVVDPVIDFNMNPTPSCEGYIVDFTGIGLYNFTDYVWDFGDGNTAIGKNTSHIFTIPAASPVTYTVTLTFCTSQVQHDILVNPLSVANAGSDTTSCEDVPVPLSALAIPPSASNYSSIFWFGGLGTFDDPFALAPTYTPALGELGAVTLYMVALGIDPCHHDTSTMTINIIEGASAHAGSDEHSCQGDPFNFANSAVPPIAYNAINMMWSGGAGSFVDPTVMVPVYIPDPNETGPITFTFIASNVINCDSMDQMVLTIHPVYEFTQNHTICFNDTLILPGGGWANTTGIYYDTLLSVWGCDSVIITDLFVYPQIDADFSITPSDSACIDDDFFFTKTGTANLVSWQWDFGDGNFSNALNPSHSYPAPGVYDVTFSFVDDLGCSDEVTHPVFVYDPPDLDFTTSASSACLNSEIIFYGLSSDDILTWDWDFGDGSTGSGQNVSHIYTTYGAIQVTLSVMATNGCQTSITKFIFVAEPPNADFTYNILSCDTIQFTDLSTCPAGYFITEWDWDFDDGTFSNLQHPAHAYASGGVYNVKLVITSDSSGMICYDSITMPVTVPDRPTVYFTWTPEPTCLGDPTQFFGTSGNPITEWYWDFDDGDFAYLQNPMHTYLDTGIYNVTLL